MILLVQTLGTAILVGPYPEKKTCPLFQQTKVEADAEKWNPMLTTMFQIGWNHQLDIVLVVF